ERRWLQRARKGEAHAAPPAAEGRLTMTEVQAHQWEFLQTRSVKWKWRQVGEKGRVLSESSEFAFLAHCMQDAERNGFMADDHVISCDKGAALWSDPPDRPV
ncbi:MAG: hypothetical protein ACXWUK_05035, partial [Burkholderiales bacterium]